jgi:1-acyl-sn-glycerol-3-phosphate acyltransferase
MLNFLPSFLIGIIATLLLGVNVLFWPIFVFIFSILKVILPFPALRRWFDQILPWLAENWISCNSGWMRLTQKTKWDVQGLEGLSCYGWYLVSSNHQSWVDIFAMQHLLNRRIPLMKFFLKRELIWVPVMGIAWWALDFPFLRRHSAEYLKKNPAQKGKDFATTRKACEKFAARPTSVMIYPEGTRFSKSRHARQQSPYQYLLRPKAGGIALALSVLGEKFHSLLNITIVYPDGIPTFWDFLCGKVKRISLRIREVELPQRLMRGDYEGDRDFRTEFQQWVEQLWQEKDVQMRILMKEIATKESCVA